MVTLNADMRINNPISNTLLEEDTRLDAARKPKISQNTDRSCGNAAVTSVFIKSS